MMRRIQQKAKSGGNGFAAKWWSGLVILFLLCPAWGEVGDPDAFWDYKTTESRTLRLHAFFPEGYRKSAEIFPVYLIFHGGGWGGGSPTTHYAECRYWSERGMLAISAEYRLKKQDQVEVPLECVRDAKSAIRYLRKNAVELKLDPDRFVVAGASAGGQLAAATSMIHTIETNDGVYEDGISTVANALVLFNPWFQCEPELSPPHHVRGGLPPTVLLLGDQDPGIPVESLLSYHEALKEAGNDSIFHVAHGGKHGFCNGRNPRNRYFYWSLQQQDRFLVDRGILTGEHQVVVPEELRDQVKELTAEDFETY